MRATVRGRRGYGELADTETAAKGRQLQLGNVTAIACNIAWGWVAGFYPEMNVFVSRDYVDKESGTPSYKYVPVAVTRAV
jgi:hypothetical protein